jgi:hypothetical protein
MTQKTLNDVTTLNRHFSCMTQSEKEDKIRGIKQDKKCIFLFELNLFSAFAYKDFFILVCEGKLQNGNWFNIIAFSSRDDLEDFVFNYSDI